MMRAILILLCWGVVSVSHAATLLWDAQTITSPLTVEKSATATGTFTTVATLPTGATSYILTPGSYGFYRVRNSAGPSNVVQFAADLFTGPVTTRLDLLDTSVANLSNTIPALPYDVQIASLMARVPALEKAPVVVPPPPAPTSNLTVRQIDVDHIEVTCNGIGITTTGTGTRRLMECRH